MYIYSTTDQHPNRLHPLLYTIPTAHHTDINECQPTNPCAPGGTCNNEANKFSCTCYPGYQGDLCDQGYTKQLSCNHVI